MSDQVAVIAGVTGVTGFTLARQLLQKNWKVYGISRRRQEFLPLAVHHVAVDLTDKEKSKAALADLKDAKYAFYATWQNLHVESKNCKINQAMFENFVDGLPGKLKHIALVTGLKHYMGSISFEKFDSSDEASPFKEDLPRLPRINMYYNQEDVLFDRAEKCGFTWSVARPGVIVGYAPHNVMNLGSALAVYATICKHLDLPFIFPGSQAAYNIYCDASDADFLAEHLIWEATTPAAANQAFNTANGDVYRWRHMWKTIGKYFGVRVEEPQEPPVNVAELMQDKEDVWAKIVDKHGLKKTKISDLAQWWFVQAIMSLPITVLADMTKSREMGFLKYQSTEKSYINLFDTMKQSKYIP